MNINKLNVVDNKKTEITLDATANPLERRAPISLPKDTPYSQTKRGQIICIIGINGSDLLRYFLLDDIALQHPRNAIVLTMENMT